MRCRTHPSDHGAGVCPLCLRDRLSALTSASDDSRKSRAVKSSLLSPSRRNPSPKHAESDAIVLKPSVSNSSFLALIMRQWRKKNKKNISPAAEDVTRGRSRKPHDQSVNGRGMSPAMKEEREEDERRISTPLRRKAQRQHSPNKLSSYAVCLSPMLRPSPGNNRRNHHGPSETVFSGDLQGTLNRKWSGVGVAVPDTSSGILGPNRSRKLVDLGKAW